MSSLQNLNPTSRWKKGKKKNPLVSSWQTRYSSHCHHLLMWPMLNKNYPLYVTGGRRWDHYIPSWGKNTLAFLDYTHKTTYTAIVFCFYTVTNHPAPPSYLITHNTLLCLQSNRDYQDLSWRLLTWCIIQRHLLAFSIWFKGLWMLISLPRWLHVSAWCHSNNMSTAL